MSARIGQGIEAPWHNDGGAEQTQAEPPTDVSLLPGRWEGRGDKDGARRRLQVDTDEQGYPWFRYCYLSQCRTTRGHTLTHVNITPTTIGFRWNARAPFTFELDGDILRGKLSFPQRSINSPMKRITE